MASRANINGRPPPPAPTPASLLDVLFLATSPNTAALSHATDLLAKLEVHPSFWTSLLDIAFERTVHLDVGRLAEENASLGFAGPSTPSRDVLDRRWSAIRSLAIIRFKAAVEKYWRSRVVNRVTITIPAETKEAIRKGLMRCLDEPDRSVATQACVSVARIARHDFPQAWPNLFHDLQRAMIDAHAGISSGQEDVLRERLILLRAADICQQTLKELASVRILAGKIRMTELAQQLLPTLVPMFRQYFAETLPDAKTSLDDWSQSPFLAGRIRTSQLLLKSVSTLAIADTGTLSRNGVQPTAVDRTNYAQDFFRGTPGMLQYVRDARWAFIEDIRGTELSPMILAILRALQKHLLSFGKLYLGLAGREKSKAVTWAGWDEVVTWYWQQAREATEEELSVTSRSGDDGSGEEELFLMQKRPYKLIVQAMLLMRQSLDEWKKTMTMPSLYKEGGTVADMVDTLVGKLMLLTQDDIDQWQEDPEEWSVAEEAETYDMDVRLAAERTLMTLAATAPKAGSKLVGELLWQKLDRLQPLSLDSQFNNALERDALYAALGRCRDHLPVDSPQMSALIASRLVPEASIKANKDVEWNILRRRIAWLIWEWSEKLTSADRPAVYGLLVSLLEPDTTDAAVCLAAARTLAALADAIEFDSDAFQPYIDASLTRLATLSASSVLHEMDSIRTCTNAMSVLIERLGARIAPHLEQLASLVPSLWMLDDPDCKARPSIIVFVGRLVRSGELIPTGSQGASTSLHGLLEVIVRDSLRPANSPLLGKDALELWIRALRSSSPMTDPLFRLIDILPDLLDQPDFCPEACRVAQESTLLAAQPVVARYGLKLFTQFARIVGDPQSPVILHPLTALDFIVQALHTQGADQVQWASYLDQSGLFYALLGSLLKVKDTTVVTGYFVALLARIAFLLKDTSLFLDLIRSAAHRLEGPQSDIGTTVIRPFIELCCARVENMASARKRKITCMGLAAMLTSTSDDEALQAAVYSSLPTIVGVWQDYMGDIRADGNEEANASIPGTPGASLSAVPNAPPSSPQLSRSNAPPLDFAQRSPSPALSIPGLEALDDEDEFTETSPGRARMTELNGMDPVNNVRLATFVQSCLEGAQSRNGPALHAAFAQMDPLVVEMFQRDLAR